MHFRVLSLSMIGGTRPSRCQLPKMARMPVPACSLRPMRRKAVNDSGIADIPLAGFEELGVGRRVGIAGVPQLCAVVKEPDHCLTGVIGIILVDQQVDRGLPEGDVVRRTVFPLQGLGIDGEGLLSALHIAVHERLPGSTRFSSITIAGRAQRSSASSSDQLPRLHCQSTTGRGNNRRNAGAAPKRRIAARVGPVGHRLRLQGPNDEELHVRQRFVVSGGSGRRRASGTSEGLSSSKQRSGSRSTVPPS